MNKIYFGDNLPILQGLENESVDLIYIDPPFNTGKVQKRTTIKTVRSETGTRKGFQGKNYETIELGTKSYEDSFDSLVDFLRPRLQEAYRILKPHGSLYFHIDYREVHYCKILLDEIFGRESFLNEIIWAYDYGGRAKSKWPPKHDNILYYVKNPENYIFNADAIDREQYIAPGLVGPAKAERGKLPTDTWWFSYVGRKPTDTWWQTIVPTNGKERVGYPTQKPRKLLDRIIKASSHPDMVVLDFFAGSGTVGESCLELGRNFILIDNNPEAAEIMAQRFSTTSIEWIGYTPIREAKAVQLKIDDPQPEFDSEYLMLAASITHLQNELEKDNEWSNNPFEWVLHIPEAERQIVGAQLIAAWCKDKGLTVQTGQTWTINGHIVETSFSLASDGVYTFQQISKESFDYLFCFGISPKQAHGWLFTYDAVWHRTESKPNDNYTFQIQYKNPPKWLENPTGNLDQVFQQLHIIFQGNSNT